MLAKLRKDHENEEGFTLIELLVVVIIIGILAAIAIPVFLNQRQKAWDSAMKSDLRNAAVIQESYFTEKGTYTDLAGLQGEGFRKSEDVTFTVPTASTTDYCMKAVFATGTTYWTLKGSDGIPKKDTAC